MMSDMYYGIVKPERLATWESNENPYDILEKNSSFVGASGWNFLDRAEKILKDKVQVDWGSFAYKASYQDLVSLRQALKCEIPELESYAEDTEFGVVFIEVS